MKIFEILSQANLGVGCFGFCNNGEAIMCITVGKLLLYTHFDIIINILYQDSTSSDTVIC
jgi:hypothetical protein